MITSAAAAALAVLTFGYLSTNLPRFGSYFVKSTGKITINNLASPPNNSFTACDLRFRHAD